MTPVNTTALEVGGVMRATVDRTFWHRSSREHLLDVLLSCGWGLEEAGDRPVPFTRGLLWRYSLTMIAPAAEARRQAQELASAQVAHPETPYVVVPTLVPPPRPAIVDPPPRFVLRPRGDS